MEALNKNSLVIGQVIAVYKDRYIVQVEDTKILSEVSGRFKYLNYLKSDYPQIGDYVKLRDISQGFGIIESICERTSILERLDVGKVKEKHILAVNIDLVLICMSLNEDYNTKKLRNFINLTYDGNFETKILLTKKDICDDLSVYISKTKDVTNNEIIPVSAFSNEDIDMIKKMIKDKTVCFLGSSGVGKSTFINKLLDEEHFETKDIRVNDAQGRHTTVNRELVHLNNGAKVIDTPGIRVVSSYFVSESHFEDILTLSSSCFYNDCKHENEPGCRVRETINFGELAIERYEQYIKAKKYNEFNKQRELKRERMQNKRLRKGR